MAHCRQHPRATASSRLRVVLISRLNTSVMTSFTMGTRQLPPTTSTESKSARVSPAQKNQTSIKYKEYNYGQFHRDYNLVPMMENRGLSLLPESAMAISRVFLIRSIKSVHIALNSSLDIRHIHTVNTTCTIMIISYPSLSPTWMFSQLHLCHRQSTRWRVSEDW